jgi:hypothetical protein
LEGLKMTDREIEAKADDIRQGLCSGPMVTSNGTREWVSGRSPYVTPRVSWWVWLLIGAAIGRWL